MSRSITFEDFSTPPSKPIDQKWFCGIICTGVGTLILADMLNIEGYDLHLFNEDSHIETLPASEEAGPQIMHSDVSEDLSPEDRIKEIAKQTLGGKGGLIDKQLDRHYKFWSLHEEWEELLNRQESPDQNLNSAEEERFQELNSELQKRWDELLNTGDSIRDYGISKGLTDDEIQEISNERQKYRQ